MDLRSGIVSTAQSLGMDPNWLAGIISYETAGTFDPAKAGPTTQWGQHRGLIQFGEPQAQQYGVDWNNPIGSQLGPDGAVAKYFRDRGWQPGMSLEQAYSIVNAGAPNRLNASDANNGGAPGTVAEKVRNQFAPHMAKGAALLGGEGNDTLQARASTQGAPMGLFGSFMGDGTGTPFIPGQSQQEPQRFGDKLRASAADGSLWDGLALAANSLRRRPDDGLAQMISQRQENREGAKRLNRTVEWMRGNGFGDLAGAVESGALSPQQAIAMVMQQPERDKGVVIDGKLVNPYTGEVMGDFADPNGGGTEYGLTPQYVTRPDGTLGMVVLGKDGTAKEVELPEGAALQRGIEKLDLGTSFQWYNSLTGEPIGAPIPKNVGEEARARAQGTEQGKLAAESEYSAPAAIDKAQRTIELIDEIARDPALPSITGNFQGRMDPGVPVIGGGQAGANLGLKIDQLQGGTFMEAYETLKGGGQITEIEGKKAEAAIARLNRVQDHESYVAALNDLKEVLAAGMARARLRSGDAGLVAPPGAPPLASTLPPADSGGISSDPLGIRQPIGGAQ